LNNCPRLTHLSLTGVNAFLRSDLEAFRQDVPQGVYLPNLHVAPVLLLTYILLEFNQHQREVFCVFSGQGVTGLRRYLNQKAEFDDDEVTLTSDDDSHSMTGVISAAAQNGREEKNEADEELEDSEDSH